MANPNDIDATPLLEGDSYEACTKSDNDSNSSLPSPPPYIFNFIDHPTSTTDNLIYPAHYLHLRALNLSIRLLYCFFFLNLLALANLITTVILYERSLSRDIDRWMYEHIPHSDPRFRWPGNSPLENYALACSILGILASSFASLWALQRESTPKEEVVETPEFVGEEDRMVEAC